MTDVLVPSLPLWEIALRGTLVYMGIVLLVRLVPKRNAGHISPNDLLTLIVIGGIGTDAIMGGSTSLLDTLLLIAVILFWAWVLDKVEYHVPLLRRLLRHRQTPLIEDGRMIRRNMRRELVTEEELMSVLRKEGIEDLAMVESACLEADGEISVMARGSRGDNQ